MIKMAVFVVAGFGHKIKRKTKYYPKGFLKIEEKSIKFPNVLS